MPKHLIAILVILLSSYVYASKDDANAVYEVTPQPHDGYEVKDGVIYVRRGSAGMMFELMTGEKIARYYADRGAAYLGNPFAGSQSLQSHTFFLVTLINRTNGNLTFTPGYVVMKIGDKTSMPLDFTELLSATESYPATIKKVLENSIFHSPQSINAGEIVSKILVYPELPRKNVDMKIDIDYLYFEDSELRIRFFYTIRKKE